MKMQSDQNRIIDALTKDLTPVERVSSPRVRTIKWLILSFAMLLFILSLHQPLRIRELFYLSEWNSWADFAIVFLLSSFFALFAFEADIPGGKTLRKNWFLLLSVSFTLVVLSYFVIRDGSSLASLRAARSLCDIEVLTLGLISTSVLLFLHNSRLQKFNREKRLRYAFVAGVGLPIALMQILCTTSLWHNILAHFLPGLGLVLVALGLERLFKQTEI